MIYDIQNRLQFQKNMQKYAKEQTPIEAAPKFPIICHFTNTNAQTVYIGKTNKPLYQQ